MTQANALSHLLSIEALPGVLHLAFSYFILDSFLFLMSFLNVWIEIQNLASLGSDGMRNHCKPVVPLACIT